MSSVICGSCGREYSSLSKCHDCPAVPTFAQFLATWMAENKITCDIEFVPFSTSRNARPRPSALGDLQINWKVTFNCGPASFSVDYSQGIGYLPKGSYKATIGGGISVYEWDRLLFAVEKGRGGPMAATKLTPPAVAHIMDCLLNDSAAIEQTFEDWAADLGYDRDSRKAETTYNACRQIAADMIRVFGLSNFNLLMREERDV